jgi:2-C-methyl-D-erythritol 4-phosphate cytidylyltransferase
VFGILKRNRGVDNDEEMRATAIILAAGQGKRLAKSEVLYSLLNDAADYMMSTIMNASDGGQGKALIDVAGVPMIAHSLFAFENAERIQNIIIVARDEDMLGIYDVVMNMNFTKVAKIIRGGETRQTSVLFGLNALYELQAAGRIGTKFVAVHDCARPCVTSQMIDKIADTVITTGHAASFGIQVHDTLKRVHSGVIVADVDRENLWHMQTPQMFNSAKLIRAHRQALEDGYEATDDVAIMQNYGERVIIIDGSPENLKVTNCMDLLIADRHLSML